MEALIGTSGWQYRDWKERFYPKDVPQRDWLPYFAERFPTVEINNTFYMLPKPETFAAWRQRTPEGFVFVVKASRYLTHIRRLRDCREPLSRFWVNARRLGKKLGPVLFQLPPNFELDLERLEGFLDLLPRTMRAAFEFRHTSWEVPEVYRALDRRGCALVIADRAGRSTARVVTGGWTYIRFHWGRRTANPGYSKRQLEDYADLLAGMDAQEAWVFFNNDPSGAAIRDAYTLTAMLEGRELSVRGPRRPARTPRAAG
jgi:uncharacterized protein YecE (DUF72 family)